MEHGKQKGNESTDITVKQTTLRTGEKNKNKKPNTPGRWWRATMEGPNQKATCQGADPEADGTRVHNLTVQEADCGASGGGEAGISEDPRVA